MGASVALCLRAHGIINLCLGILALLRPWTFLTTILSPSSTSKPFCNPEFSTVLTRSLHEHGYQHLTLGVFLLLVAGQPATHKTATMIMSVVAGVGLGTYLAGAGDVRKAGYHVVWCLLQHFALRFDERREREGKEVERREKKKILAGEKGGIEVEKEKVQG